MSRIEYQSAPLSERTEAVRVLRPLAENFAESYFLSWGWLSNLLDMLPENLPAHLVWAEGDGGEPLAACILGMSRQVRSKVIPRRCLHLNATGNPVFDNLYIEYNSILRKEGFEPDLGALLAALPGAWDELLLPGLDCNGYPARELAENPLGHNLISDKRAPSWFVDLEAVRERGGYLPLLSKGMRKEINRSYRLYEEMGPIATEVADCPEKAADIFDALVDLHQRRWTGKGEAGAFASEWFPAFHRKLIRERFPEGEIQLVRVRAGETLVGCRYNFVFKKRVFGYQTGLNYAADPKLKPGYVSAAEAVMYNAREGNLQYDFLGGSPDPGSSKGRLSTGHNELCWLRLQKKRLRFRLENGLRSLLGKSSPDGEEPDASAD